MKTKAILVLWLIFMVFSISAFGQQNAEDWFNKGVALYDLGKYDEAIQAFDEAIRLDPNYTNAWNNKGYALNNRGNYDEAIKAYDKAIEINPQLAEAWYNKGVVLELLGRTAEANDAFAKAEALGINIQ